MDMSILNSTKKMLGIDPNDDSFDPDIVTHINSAFSTLRQLGLDGLFIQDETTRWDELFPGVPDREWLINLVRTLIYLRVRIIFDPPATSYLQDAYAKQIAEHEWRLNTWREGSAWVDPNPPIVGETV
jgi:hypothetical protein